MYRNLRSEIMVLYCVSLLYCQQYLQIRVASVFDIRTCCRRAKWSLWSLYYITRSWHFDV